MSNVIPFKQEKIQDRKCSFCGRKESEVKKFVASTISNHCICGDCIKQATNRLQETKK